MDLVRVEIKLVRLSVDGREDIDFFFSSIRTLGFSFSFDGGAFRVEIDEHNEEFDLLRLTLIDETGVPNRSSFFVNRLTDVLLLVFILIVESVFVFVGTELTVGLSRSIVEPFVTVRLLEETVLLLIVFVLSVVVVNLDEVSSISRLHHEDF